MRTLLGATARVCVALLGFACSDSNSSSKASDAGALTDAERTCPALCKRAGECGVLASKNLSEALCESLCSGASSMGECPAFTEAEIKTCTSAAAKQSCADVEAGVALTACTKQCDVANTAVAVPTSLAELFGP